MKMTFGKYKGELVDDLPTGYITWLLENCNLDARLIHELQSQLDAREGKGIVREDKLEWD